MLPNALGRRLRAMFARDTADREMDDELRLHFELQARELERRGLDASVARRATTHAFGGMEQAREAYRDASGIPVVEHLMRDTRYAVRRLLRARSFSLGVMATIGVGVGAAAAIGALVYGILLRPLPFPRPDQLVQVAFRAPGLDGGREHAHSQATFVHLRETSQSFSAFGGYHVNDAVNLTDRDDPVRVTVVMATPSLFAALGVRPALGDFFTEADGDLGVEATIPVMISHDLWRQRYAGDSSIVGRLIEVNRRPRRVAGVLPAGFGYPTPAVQVWFPLSLQFRRARLDSRYINVVARLRDGVEVDEARGELSAVVQRIPSRYPAITPEDLRRSGAVAEVTPLKEAIVAPVREHLRMLALTMLFVLLIATANVTNLFLLRGERQRHEIAISIALGGGAAAIARRFVVEGAVLGAAAAILALPVVAVSLTSRFGFSPRELPRLHEVGFGVGPIAATLLLCVGLGAFVGLLAFARAGRVTLHAGLRAATRTSTSGLLWRRMQQSLVAVQVAVALALLSAAALMGRSLWNLSRAELGFDPEQRSTFEVTLPFKGYENYTSVALFHTAILDRLRAQRGVDAVEAALEIPLIAENPTELSLEYGAVGTAVEVRAAANMATPGYFRAMGIPLLQGRSFESGDVRAENPGIVLSASLARALFGTTDVLGRLVRPPSSREDIHFRVVGVVGDVPRWRIEDGPAAMAYFPALRDGDGVPIDRIRVPILMGTARYVVRSAMSSTELTPAMRAAVRGVDARIPVTNITSLEEMVGEATARVRLTMLLLGVAAAAALLLGMIGIYSVMSYAIAGRRREIGVRIALGATPRRIQRMIVGEGSIAVAAGVVVGLAVALYAGRLAQSMLYNVSARDPLLFGSAGALLAIVACVAAWIPARRAAQLDPVEVMRAEE